MHKKDALEEWGYWFTAKVDERPIDKPRIEVEVRGRLITGDELADYDDEFSITDMRFH